MLFEFSPGNREVLIPIEICVRQIKQQHCVMNNIKVCLSPGNCRLQLSPLKRVRLVHGESAEKRLAPVG